VLRASFSWRTSSGLQLVTKKIAISQSNHGPWKGYFDRINSIDEFVLYDDIQFTRLDWRNCNQIKTPSGPRWRTIPVEVRGNSTSASTRPLSAIPTGPASTGALEVNYAHAAHLADFREGKTGQVGFAPRG
jgi:hypothetical protein